MYLVKANKYFLRFLGAAARAAATATEGVATDALRNPIPKYSSRTVSEFLRRREEETKNALNAISHEGADETARGIRIFP